MYSPMIGEVRMMLQNMRKAKDAIRGDGFGRAGYLKSEFKKAIRRLESLQAMLEEGPLPEAAEIIDSNPDCCGHLIDNIPNCTCRLIAESLTRKSSGI
jgi:hypothetical protein